MVPMLIHREFAIGRDLLPRNPSHSEPGHRPEMRFIIGADEHPESQMEGCRGSGKIVGGNEAARAAEAGKEIRPALGNFRSEADDWNS